MFNGYSYFPSHPSLYLSLPAHLHKCLQKRLEPSTCLSVRAFADQYMCSSLVEAANRYVQNHFSFVATTQDFLSLSKADLLEVLSRDELYVNTEEQVSSVF